MNKRFFSHFLLALLLLLAQQGAAVHALSHLAESVPAHSQQDKNPPHSPACDKCIAYAEVGGGVHSAPLFFHGELALTAQQFVVDYDFSSRTFRAYSSRAPPRLA